MFVDVLFDIHSLYERKLNFEENHYISQNQNTPKSPTCAVTVQEGINQNRNDLWQFHSIDKYFLDIYLLYPSSLLWANNK